jgi:hypothetical protein
LVVDRDGKVLATEGNEAEIELLLMKTLGPPLPDFSKTPRLTLKNRFPQMRGQTSPPVPIPAVETPTWVIIFIAVVGALVLVPLAGLLAYQAHQRGYNSVIWFLTGVVSFNPLFPLVVLALLPFRSRQMLRLKERNALNAKLGGAAPEAAPRALAPHGRPAPSTGPSLTGSTKDYPAPSLENEEK